MCFFHYAIFINVFLCFVPTPKWVSDWLLLVFPQASMFFVLLLLCCLKSSMCRSDGCCRSCCMLPIVSTISNSNRSTQDKVVFGYLLVRTCSASRVLSLLQLCKWLALPSTLRMPCVFKEVLSSAASTVGALSPSYLFTVHFISFSSFYAVSLYPTRATLAPLDMTCQ